MFLSEEEVLSDLKFEKNRQPPKLIWWERGLTYGEWTDGPNGDGTREAHVKFDTSEVSKIYIITNIFS